MRLRLLDRYVLTELLYPFVFGIAAFSSIFIASTMLFRITKYVTQYGASLEAVGRLFFYSLPEVINYTFPMSMLLAALMAFGKLSGSSEITAMKAGGVSYYRIVTPVLIVGFLVSMFSLVWAEKVVPSLFPFFVLTRLMIYYQVPQLIGKLLTPLFKSLLHLSPITFFVMFLSMISGNPSGSKMARDYYDQHLIFQNLIQHQ